MPPLVLAQQSPLTSASHQLIHLKGSQPKSPLPTTTTQANQHDIVTIASKSISHNAAATSGSRISENLFITSKVNNNNLNKGKKNVVILTEEKSITDDYPHSNEKFVGSNGEVAESLIVTKLP